MELVDVIRDLGFPIAVATFVLVRLNGKMDRLTSALVSMTMTMEKFITQERADEAEIELRDENRTAAAVTKILDNQQRILDAIRLGK